MIMGGQLDGLLSHWQPAFANKLMMNTSKVLMKKLIQILIRMATKI